MRHWRSPGPSRDLLSEAALAEAAVAGEILSELRLALTACRREVDGMADGVALERLREVVDKIELAIELMRRFEESAKASGVSPAPSTRDRSDEQA